MVPESAVAAEFGKVSAFMPVSCVRPLTCLAAGDDEGRCCEAEFLVRHPTSG